MAVVQTKEIRIYIHKRNNKKHATNNTKHSKHKNTFTKHPHITKHTHTQTHTLQNKLKQPQYKIHT